MVEVLEEEVVVDVRDILVEVVKFAEEVVDDVTLPCRGDTVPARRGSARATSRPGPKETKLEMVIRASTAPDDAALFKPALMLLRPSLSALEGCSSAHGRNEYRGVPPLPVDQEWILAV